MPTYEITLIGLIILHIFAVIGALLVALLVGIWLFYWLAVIVDKIEERRK